MSGWHHHSDEALIEAGRRESVGAFAELMRRHERAVFIFLCRMADDPGQAEDWAQEAFLKAWPKLGQCRDPGAVRSWFYAIAARTALDHRRQMRRGVVRDAAWAFLRENADLGEATEALVDLQVALARLPDRDRLVAALVFGAELTQAEAAVALHLPLGTVKTRMNRARGRLAELLHAWAPDSGPKRKAERGPND